ncbi:hypothetical protein [Rheinheimera aquimaris]|uniref:hypothetical protein n=1 Tax=Rheinheimera aquimaris TaxID=412437 RepID=UPI0010657E29|nr:hypothetical protein [Rheinheimera aquimaris]
MIRLFFILLLVLPPALLADDEHLRLALVFEDLSSSSDKLAFVDSMMPLIEMHAAGDESKIHKIHAFLVKALQSEEYRRSKAEVYKRQFSEEELRQLIELVKTPAYKLLNERRHDIALDTQRTMILFMQKTLQDFQNLDGD